MKYSLKVFFLFFCSILSGQSFIEATRSLPFEPVSESSVAFADIDGDGDQDVVISGRGLTNVITKLYINENGKYSEVINTPFVGVSRSSIGFADVDGDNDPDLLITGSVSNSESVSKLYLNDGSGGFSEAVNTPFQGVDFGSIGFADVDGDNDLDLLITGLTTSNVPISRLYSNDGNGNFSEMTQNSIIGVWESSIAFADIDGDNDPDLLVTGWPDGDVPISKIYTNNGGIFTELPNNSIEPVFLSSVAFSDIDGDNDQDLLITGLDSNEVVTAKLYLNEQGVFTEIPNTPLRGHKEGSVIFVDIDNDLDADIITSGIDISGRGETWTYINDGGTFTLGPQSFQRVSRSSIAASDTDGDGDLDILVTGYGDFSFGEPEKPVANLYTNANGIFTDVSDNWFEESQDGSITFADVDLDNDLDVVITGNHPFAETQTLLYLNNSGFFSKAPVTPFADVQFGDLIFGDIDGDQDLDVILSGRDEGIYVSEMYINENGNYIAGEIPLLPTYIGAMELADVDGDNDLDLLSTGAIGMFADPNTQLYLNDGTGEFTLSASSTIEDFKFSRLAFADIDDDNDQDLLISGMNDDEDRKTNLYKNDGSGNFTLVENTPFFGMIRGDIDFADIDGDNDLDVLIIGDDSSSDKVATLYLNDGSGNFSLVDNTPFIGATRGSCNFADVDGDQDMDVLISGRMDNTHLPVLYINDGSGNFTIVVDTPFENSVDGDHAFADIDKDGDLDVLILGESTKLYINQSQSGNPAISGHCFYDLNENQILDANELPLFNQKIQISSDNDEVISYPNEEGKYKFYLETGAYQLTAIPEENWESTTTGTIDLDFQGTNFTDINFGFIPTTPVPLIEPVISSGPTRCSFDVPFWIKNKNSGTTTEDGYLELTLTEGAVVQSVEPTPSAIIGNNYYWNFEELLPTQSQDFFMIIKMPDASNIGEILNFAATSFLINDNQDTITNTVYNYNPVLNCAYDPNDKAVIPTGIGNYNLTLFDNEFEYRIRFQNTGTDTAFTVRIEDDLDPNLNWNTFRPVSASHPYEVNMDVETGKVTFLFRDILLPDSTTNEPLSHGFVKYKISPLSNLAEETEITNEAGIFFDFNPPIITNMTLNTMVSSIFPTNTIETKVSKELKVIPNPFQKNTIFRIKEIPGDRGTLNIFNTNGVLVYSKSVVSDTDVTFRKDDLASGVYFYEVVNEENRRVFGGKVIKFN